MRWRGKLIGLLILTLLFGVASALGQEPRAVGEIRSSNAATTEHSKDVLRGHGLDIEIVNREVAIVQGWVPMDNLEPLAAEAVVTKIQPLSYGRPRSISAHPRTGSV